ncbi:MAG: glycerate kinase [Leucothrix sp.]
MMKILIAPDSFKESLSAEGVAKAIARGFHTIFPDTEYVLLPVADGGEGTTDALVAATGGRRFTQQATGPIGESVEAFWGLLGDGKTAVVETAAASGLDLIDASQRDPLTATTRGTGELILAAVAQGAKHIIVGLGGSATNDGGAGMLQALGLGLLDAAGEPIPSGGGGLAKLARIDLDSLDPRLVDVRFDVACDVNNPLVGDNGASAIFGPQKGATPDMVKVLDSNLAHFAQITQQVTAKDIINIPGAGAAGGLGGAFLGFLNATLKSGIDIVLDAVDYEAQLEGVSLVITGEGRIDSQTICGKTPIGVSKRAKAVGDIPVIALAGSVSEDAAVVHEHGIDALFSVVPGVVTLDNALATADENLYRTARNVAKVWQLSL